jgi:hypothetical protein
MFQEIIAPLPGFLLFAVLLGGWYVSKKPLKLPRVVTSIIGLAAAVVLMISLASSGEQILGMAEADDDIPDYADQGIWDIDLAADNTAGDWLDTIVADVDLWAATNESTCSNDQSKCTAIITYTYSSGGVVASLWPDEALITFTVKNGNDIAPPGVTACDNGCWPLVAKMGAIPRVYNTTDGNTLPVADMNSDGEWNAYWEDKSGSGVRTAEHQEINIGNFQPGESDATIRFGIKLEPATFGAGGVTAYDSWFIFIELGGHSFTLELQVVTIV